MSDPKVTKKDNTQEAQTNDGKTTNTGRPKGLRSNTFEEVAKWAYSAPEVKKEAAWSYTTIFFIIFAILILIFLVYWFFLRKSSSPDPDKSGKKSKKKLQNESSEYSTEELDLEDPDNDVLLSEMRKSEKQIPTNREKIKKEYKLAQAKKGTSDTSHKSYKSRIPDTALEKDVASPVKKSKTHKSEANPSKDNTKLAGKIIHGAAK